MLLSDLSLDEVRRAANGRWRIPPARPEQPCPPLGTDTRALARGDVFVALTGDNFDGHAFLGRAVEAGACGLVVAATREHPAALDASAGLFVLEVDCPLTALGDIAAAVRQRATGGVVGVVGSSGKTTTKDMLARILRLHAGEDRVLSTTANHNNLVGVPKMLLDLREQHVHAVLEAGMNQPGELARLAEIMAPDLSIMTNIGTAHRGMFASEEEHLRAKLDWLTHMPAGRRVLLNGDSRLLPRMEEAATHLQVRYFGHDHDDTLAWPRRVELMDPVGYSFLLMLPDGEFPVTLPMFGDFSVANAVAAAAAAYMLGVGGRTIAAALSTMTSGKMRGEVREIAGRRFILDCYNASPEAMMLAIHSAGELHCTGRKFAVLGDMLELADLAPRAHRNAGRTVVGAGFHALYTVGELTLYAIEAAAAQGMRGTHCTSTTEVAERLACATRPGDLVLLKGSRRMGLEHVAAILERILSAHAAVA